MAVLLGPSGATASQTGLILFWTLPHQLGWPFHKSTSVNTVHHIDHKCCLSSIIQRRSHTCTSSRNSAVVSGPKIISNRLRQSGKLFCGQTNQNVKIETTDVTYFVLKSLLSWDNSKMCLSDVIGMH